MFTPCYTCRRRHIQCDRSQTPCSKCQKAGLECLDKRPLRWVKGVAVRGRLQGVSAEDASASAAVSRLARVELGMGKDIGMGSLRPVLEDSSLMALKRVDRYFLNYYNDQICKLFIVYDSDKNPFRSLISLAMNDSILMKAVLALAAQHKANAGHSSHESLSRLTDTHQQALVFKHQAIRGLSQAVKDVSMCRDTTVASIFLLVFLDLLESGSDQWNVHLEGAKSLIALNPGIGRDPGQTVQGIRDFIAKQIYLIETLGATLVRPRLLSQFTPPGMLQDTVEQSFLGCPEYLLDAIQYLSHQRDAIVCLDAPDNEELTTVLISIQIFDCDLWATNLPHHSPTRDINKISALSQAYKLGALIYGQRVLDALTHQQQENQTHLTNLLSVISFLRDDTPLFKCILWPMCIAALECPWPAQREFLCRCLEKFWRDTRCLNVVNAARVLRKYWEWVDGQEAESRKSWIFNIGLLGGDWLMI